MPYIGNTVQVQGFTPAIDYFNGNGVTVTFTLTRPVVSVSQMIVVIDNVVQNPSSAYTVSGNSITFTSAPLLGVNNIWVEYTSLITTYAAISQSPSVIGDITASGGYLANGNFGNTFVDGTIIDYVTGNARITTGPADGMTFYNGGTSARSAMGTFDSSGNFGLGTTLPTQKLDVSGNAAITGTGYLSLQRPIIPVVNQGTPQIAFQYYTTGTTYTTGALITASAEGTWTASSAPTRLQFYTAPSGSTSALERMRIDSNGYVTVPYQVAFHVRVNNANYITTSPIPFSNAVYNVGSAWNTSTYTFTAPVAGRYMFLMVGYVRVTNSAGGFNFQLIVNGTRRQYSDDSPGVATSYATVPLTSVLSLSVGDTVSYNIGASNASYYGGNEEMNLFGWLLG